MNMVLRPGKHRFTGQPFRQTLNPGAAGDGEHRVGIVGLVDDVQEKILDALAIDAHLQDLHLFAFQAEGHVQGRSQLRHLLAAAAQTFRGTGVAAGDEKFAIGAHHLLDFGEGFSFSNNHNCRPLTKIPNFRVRPAGPRLIVLFQ